MCAVDNPVSRLAVKRKSPTYREFARRVTRPKEYTTLAPRRPFPWLSRRKNKQSRHRAFCKKKKKNRTRKYTRARGSADRADRRTNDSIYSPLRHSREHTRVKARFPRSFERHFSLPTGRTVLYTTGPTTIGYLRCHSVSEQSSPPNFLPYVPV